MHSVNLRTPSPTPSPKKGRRPLTNAEVDEKALQESRRTIPTAPTVRAAPSVQGSAPVVRQKRRTFGSVVRGSGAVEAKDKRQSLKKTTLHDDLTFHDVEQLPDVCEVTSPDLQDPELAEYYVGLPPLK